MDTIYKEAIRVKLEARRRPYGPQQPVLCNDSDVWTVNSMTLYRYLIAFAAILAPVPGCGSNNGPQSNVSTGANMYASSSRERKVDNANEFGFAKLSIRDGDVYEEGIVDAQGNEVVQASSNMLVNNITGNLAIVQFERKFLFVPLDQGFTSTEEMVRVKGFQYAEPYSCGLAMVSVDDVWFYIDPNFEKAFNSDFEFAESFHHDRALVKADGRFRIIDTLGKTVADLKYDQISPQSPWCWQVTRIENEKYLNGFVDLNGTLVTELIYDDVGFYDAEVKRIRVCVNKRHGFLDEYAKVAIPLQYEHAEAFDRGVAKVVLNGRSFFINPDGLEVPE